MEKIRFPLLIAVCFAAARVLAAPANDAFTNSVRMTATNFVYSGNFIDATLEPGERQVCGTNTVWVSWAAPADGYVEVSQASACWAVFTGAVVDELQPVSTVPRYMNGIYRFAAKAGTDYHYQCAGGAGNFTFSSAFQAFGLCTNDNFADAQVVKGRGFYLSSSSLIGATMEPGEPAHMGPGPQKSLWWKWQAPQWGVCFFDPRASLATNYVVGVYEGSALESLTLVTKATNGWFTFPIHAARTYYIAAAVPTNTFGDMFCYLQLASVDTATHIVPGNCLREPSWEGTALLDAQYWKWSGGLAGFVNELGGADGTTWPALVYDTRIWQDFPTVPGHAYTAKFAFLIGGALSGGTGDGQVEVFWDGQQVGVSTIPATEGGFWHWDENYTLIASNTTSRIAFHNVARTIEMDAFSIVDVTAAPEIVSQPGSVSSIVGGTAAFNVGATGTAPLIYQWFFNSSPLPGQTNRVLALTALTTNDAGNYQVTVTNRYGSRTSEAASLQVEGPLNATILFQPYGDTVPVGGFFNFSVVASGTPPLTWQWFRDGQEVSGATNRNLMLTNVQPTDAGVYTVRVQNPSSTVWSLPAPLIVTTSDPGGGMIDFRNRMIAGVSNANAPVFDLDGVTWLSGSKYVAQLYAGPSLALLRPAGQPTPFQEGYYAGYFVPQTLTLGNVPPGSNAVVQVRSWDTAFGITYEEARQLGGRAGKSQVLNLVAGSGPGSPAPLEGLESFSLQAGLPYLQVASIEFVERQPPHTLVWSLQGQPNTLYLIEKSHKAGELVWRPYQVVTNITGSVTFTDTTDSGSNAVFYRARILD